MQVQDKAASSVTANGVGTVGMRVLRVASALGRLMVGGVLVSGAGRAWGQTALETALDGSRGFILESDTSTSFAGLGVSVAGAGDVNGDGLSDLIVGQPQKNRAYVVLGRTNGFPAKLPVQDVVGEAGFRIQWPDEGYGAYSVAGVGDVNGDGLADVCVGSPQSEISGRAAVVFGRRTGSDVVDAGALGTNGFLIADAGGTNFLALGVVVAGAGDLNGDGVSDVALGAMPRFGPSNFVFVVFGKAAGGFSATNDVNLLDGSEGVRAVGFQANFTRVNTIAPAAVGDINGDGVDDLMAGLAPRYAAGQFINTGLGNSSALLFGRTNGWPSEVNLGAVGGSNGFIVISSDLGGAVGMGAAGGDIDGDGARDLVLTRCSAAGQSGLHVVWGDSALGTTSLVDLATFEPASRMEVVGSSAQRSFGRDAAAGDINGDGLDDLVASVGAAEAYVLFGATNRVGIGLLPSPVLDEDRGFRVDVRTGTQFANNRAAAMVGDMNGDGLEDFALGGVGTAALLQQPSRVYVIFGQPDFRPAVVALSPTNGAGSVDRLTVFELTLDRPVAAGSGRFELRRAGTGDVVQTFPVPSEHAIFEERTVRLVPSVALDAGTMYEIHAVGSPVQPAGFGLALRPLGAGAWQFVTRSTSALTVESSVNPARLGEAVTFRGVTLAGGGPGSGAVQFFDGTNALGMASTDGQGISSVTVTNLPVGVRNIHARFTSATAEPAAAVLMPLQTILEPAGTGGTGGSTGGTGGAGNGSGFELPWEIVIQKPKAGAAIAGSIVGGGKGKAGRLRGRVEETGLPRGSEIWVEVSVGTNGATNATWRAVDRIKPVNRKGVARFSDPAVFAGASGLPTAAGAALEIWVRAGTNFAVSGVTNRVAVEVK